MGLKADATAEVRAILSGLWATDDTAGVPDPQNLRLDSNHAKNLKAATVLYADLDGSTSMVDKYKWWFAAEIYKAYLRTAARIIRDESGTITAYDGDRVMAIFIGNSKNTNAVRAALKINYAVEKVLRPAISAQYPTTDFTLKHVIGIDTSSLHAVRIGVRGDNDIVWVGRAANYAAKLCSESAAPIWITKAVHENIHDSVKNCAGKSIWAKYNWTAMENQEIYATTYVWTLD